MSLRLLTDAEADEYALSLTPLQRRILMLCSQRQSIRYRGLAAKAGVSGDQARETGWHLQAANLATIETTRHGREFSGSAIFLNARGEAVKDAILRLSLQSI